MILGVVFDFDNTLYDYDTCNKHALQELFKLISSDHNISFKIIENKFNIITDIIKYSNNCSNKFNKTIYVKLLIEQLEIPFSNFEKYHTLYKNTFYEKMELYEDVLPLFDLLKRNGLKICVFSNNIFIQQFEKIKKMGILNFIDLLQTSDECGEEKPNEIVFNNIIAKIKIPFENLACIGDNYKHDIEPSLNLGMFSFWKKETDFLKIKNKVVEFEKYADLMFFFENYFSTISQYVYLSSYFGQSILNVQGQGGNISIKMKTNEHEKNDILFIKSSGHILGETTNTNGFCLVDNEKWNENLEKNENTPNKIFGMGKPSMETFFHSFMKKYVIHLHFTLSNIFFCSDNNNDILTNFKKPYVLIDYYSPGIILAKELKIKYQNDCDIYFLKNHGIIITGETIKNIIDNYEYIFHYFNLLLNNKYDDEYVCFKIRNVFCKKTNLLVRKTHLSFKLFEDFVLCFPDIAIFSKNILKINKIEELNNMEIPDIIIFNNNVYLITETWKQMNCLIEIIESYNEIIQNSKKKITSINKIQNLINSQDEMYRKQKK